MTDKALLDGAAEELDNPSEAVAARNDPYESARFAGIMAADLFPVKCPPRPRAFRDSFFRIETAKRLNGRWHAVKQWGV